MILRDLVDHPDLGLSLITGEAALDRPVTGVFTTDLLDPRRYLTDGLLVLSGLMWRREPADSDTFVQALAEAGVVALGAGEAAFGTIPADVADACRRHGVALLRVPVEVSFGRISDVVATAHQAERGRSLTAALVRQHRLLAAIAAGKSITDLLVLAGAETGLACRVFTPTGRQVAAAAPALDAAAVDRVCHTFLTADRLPTAVTLPHGSDVSIIAVDSRLDQRLTPWFLTCDGDHTKWSEDTHAALRELATVVAMEHRRWDDDRRARRRIADDVVALVATGRSDTAEVAVRLADLGVPPYGHRLVATLSLHDGPAGADLIHAVLHDAALHLDGRPVTGMFEGRAVSILSSRQPDDAGRLRAAVTRLAPAVGPGRVTVGLSTWVSPGAVSGALTEALHAARLADLSDAAISVVSSDEVTSHVLLLGALPDELRHTFAQRVLGPVLEYDDEHGAGLLDTLHAFLEVDGSWSRCAEAMHVHVNTVRYRIRRVEELTGRDLTRLSDRVDVFLALRSLRAGG